MKETLKFPTSIFDLDTVQTGLQPFFSVFWALQQHKKYLAWWKVASCAWCRSVFIPSLRSLLNHIIALRFLHPTSAHPGAPASSVMGCGLWGTRVPIRNLKCQFNFPRFGSETLDYKSFSEKWIPKVVWQNLLGNYIKFLVKNPEISRKIAVFTRAAIDLRKSKKFCFLGSSPTKL